MLLCSRQFVVQIMPSHYDYDTNCTLSFLMTFTVYCICIFSTFQMMKYDKVVCLSSIFFFFFFFLSEFIKLSIKRLRFGLRSNEKKILVVR